MYSCIITSSNPFHLSLVENTMSMDLSNVSADLHMNSHWRIDGLRFFYWGPIDNTLHFAHLLPVGISAVMD